MIRKNISSGYAYEDVYGYSRAVRVGDHIHVAGTTAPGPDAYSQARNALSIIENALHEAGSSLAAVVRTVTYITDTVDPADIARAHLESFADVRPAATMVGVTRLIGDNRHVEIEAYAIDPTSTGS